jgi:hypothetical protein
MHGRGRRENFAMRVSGDAAVDDDLHRMILSFRFACEFETATQDSANLYKSRCHKSIAKAP